MRDIVVFTINDKKYAIPCKFIEQIVNIVAITPLPQAPKKILGIINVHGEIITVLNIDMILDIHEREIDLNNKLVILKTEKRKIAFIVDKVDEVVNVDNEQIVNMESIIPNPDIYEGTLKMNNGLILIYNTDKFLSLEEEKHLNKILKK